MKVQRVSYFANKEGTNIYELELSDFTPLFPIYKVTKSLNGFDLISLEDDKLSIHIGQYDIKYDKNISHLKMMIATHRVEIRKSILITSDHSNDFMNYIPKSHVQLYKLVEEIK